MQGEIVGKQIDLLQGTLDMLILKAVSLSPQHGYGVLLRIQQVSGEQLQIQQGSLYPALYRLEHQGLIASEWGESEDRKSTRLNSSHQIISYAVFCLKKKKNKKTQLSISILSM